MNTNRTALTTWASRLGSLAVAGVAGYASFRHIVHVATMAGETPEVAAVYPLAIDGLIVVGTMAMLADKAQGRAPRLSARVALGFGIVATLAANVASAQPTVLARLVAAVPAVAFLLAVEVLARRGKLLPAEEVAEMEAADETDPEDTRPAPRRTAPAKPRPTVAAQVAALAARYPGMKPAGIAAKLAISERTARRYMPKPEAAPVAVEARTGGRSDMSLDLGHYATA